MTESVDQQGAHAGGDVVAGNKTVVSFHPVVGPGVIQKLLEKLQHQIAADKTAQETIEHLKLFQVQKASGGAVGLEAKLHAANRAYEIDAALEKKELFVKALERWSLYPAAQELFVHLLAKAEHEFSMSVFPHVDQLDPSAINAIVTAKIVDPIVQECGDGVLSFNHRTVMGMVYWLAEQCFVRWHK